MVFVKAAISSVLGIGLIVYAIFAIYEGSWTLTKSVVNHQYQVTQDSQQNQDTYKAQIIDGMVKLSDDQRQYDLDQKSGDKNLIANDELALDYQAGELCKNGEYVSAVTAEELDAATQAWFKTNCNMGVVSPDSQYRVPVSSNG